MNAVAPMPKIMDNITFPPPSVAIERRHDGSILLRSTLPVIPPRRSTPHLLDEQAARTPDRPFIRQRLAKSGPWRQITYDEAAQASRNVAQWLIDRGLGEGDVIAVLSGASIEHIVLVLGAQRAGVATAPLSVNYSILSQTHEKLRRCVSSVNARYVFADDPVKFAPAMRSLAADGLACIVTGRAVDGVSCIDFQTVLATQATSAVDGRMDSIMESTIARILFTSGSTGWPKACAQTQGTLMAGVAQVEAMGFLAFPQDDAPQMLEALPFSHVFAGSFNLNNSLRAGATINLDDGKPVPHLFPQTIANLKEVSPSCYATAPIGLIMLTDALEQDATLRQSFFKKLQYMIFGGAMLPRSIRARLVTMGFKETGRHIPLIAMYGQTEGSPMTVAYWETPHTDIIGLPTAGTELKLTPKQGKYEISVSGPTIMRRNGYMGSAELNALAFDEEGFLRTGDAAKFADPENPAAGLMFDGRFGEQFKLTNGTWVAGGVLRTELMTAADPLLREAVVCGENRDVLGVLGWLNEPAIRHLFPEFVNSSALEISTSPMIREALTARIRSFNDKNSSSSQRIARFLLLSTALSFDANEVTDKGSANLGAIQDRRASDVERLFAKDTPPEVLRFDR